MSQNIQPAKVKESKPEMWMIMLAKSKTMRFFAVSCEFIIFLGCLWLTLVTILPSATGWAWGGIDKFFMVAMGFAVDAALPEAWLHVVDQYLEKKKAQLKWSIPIAVAMLLLVIANIVYTKVTGQSDAKPTSAMEAIVNTLLIARMFIGISYVTIRECQSFIDRKQYQQHPQTPPALPADDPWPLIGMAAFLQQQTEQALSALKNSLQVDMANQIMELASNQKQSLADIQQHLLNLQSQMPEVDTQIIAGNVLASLESRFTGEMKRLQNEMKQQVSISVERETQQYRSISLQAEKGISPNVKPGNTKNETQQYGQSKSGNILPFHQETQETAQETENRKVLVIRAYNEDTSRSDDDIVALTGVPKTTVWRYLKPYRDRAKTGEIPAISTTETA